jgi:hypothetical protein
LGEINGILGKTVTAIKPDALPPMYVALNTEIRGGDNSQGLYSSGMPTTYIIDKNGILKDFLSGWTKEEDDPVTKENWFALMASRRFDLLMNRHDAIGVVIQRLDQVIAKQPELEGQLLYNKYFALTAYDFKSARNYAKYIGEVILKEDPSALNDFAWAVIGCRGPAFVVDVKVAAELADLAAERTKNMLVRANSLDTAGYAYYMLKDMDKALDRANKALEAAQAVPDMKAAELQVFVDRIAQWKAVIAKGGG